jgi:hypothetical protein
MDHFVHIVAAGRRTVEEVRNVTWINRESAHRAMSRSVDVSDAIRLGKGIYVLAP